MAKRYIDADLLVEKLEQHFDVMRDEDGRLLYSDHICTGEDCDDLLKLVNAMPTADVVEVRHGEWIDKWNGKYANPTYACSNCGEKALLESYINELDQWRYRQSLSIRCPHCGAKMDGERKTE